MPVILKGSVVPSHHTRVDDVPLKMAKAAHTICVTDESTVRRRIGEAIAWCFDYVRLTDQQAADLIGKERAQVAKWISGVERPHFDAIFAIPLLRVPMVLALASLAEPDGVQIRHQIELPERRAK